MSYIGMPHSSHLLRIATGELSGQGDCETLQTQCEATEPLSSPDDGSCEPDCDNVTVDEYVACSEAMMELSVDFFAGITCDGPLDLAASRKSFRV